MLAFSKENSLSQNIPYTHHADPCTLKTTRGDYVQMFHLKGLAFESQSLGDLAFRGETFNKMLTTLARPGIALWSHLVRRQRQDFPGGTFAPGFCATLNKKYYDKMSGHRLMVNDLYLTVLYRPFQKKNTLFRKGVSPDREKELKDLYEASNLISNFLQEYGPRRLTTIEKNGVSISEPVSFLSSLVNMDTFSDLVFPKGLLSEALPKVRPVFYRDFVHLRGVADQQFAACLSISEYAEATEIGMLNGLLAAPFSFVLTQSFSFMSKQQGQELMQRQQRRMRSIEDLGVSQIEAINTGLDDLTSGRFSLGMHHATLFVLGETQGDLEDNLSKAKAAMVESFIQPVREDLALEAAFWAQLPGNFSFRPRPSPVTSQNFSDFSSFHNHPSGQLKGMAWGDALTLFKTSSGTPLYFSFHEEGRGKPLANSIILGPSGSGKTVVQGFLLAQAQKFKPTVVVFDKDRGLDIFVRALDGTYLSLEVGKPTGFNPFQLPPTPSNIAFLERLVHTIVSSRRALGAMEEKELSDAVRSVLTLSPKERRFSSLLPFLDGTEDNGASQYLARWCEGGALSWVFDNEEDELDVTQSPLLGFDVTEFLEDGEVRGPLLFYLFHRIEELIDGRRFMAFMDEFWKLLLDEPCRDWIHNKLKVIRKQNGLLVLGTQSARDVTQSKIAHTLIEQSSTFLFLGNPKAKEEDHKSFGLTPREIEIVRQLPPRRFLVKRGLLSAVAELDLAGFEEELAIISGTTDNIALAERIRGEVGEDPKIWVPIFQRELKA